MCLSHSTGFPNSTILKGKGLKPASWKEMFSPQVRIRSKRQFGPLSAETTTDNDDIALSYGLGWGLLQTPYGRGAFKEGHGDGFEHYSIVFPERRLGVVIMTNSANGESIFKELLEVAIADARSAGTRLVASQVDTRGDPAARLGQ